MKKLLFLPLVLISCLCLAQNPKAIIGKPIKIGNILVAQYDFPERMNWYNSEKSCWSLGEGWRLPTRKELNTMYVNKDKIGRFENDVYWSSTESNEDAAWCQLFAGGAQGDPQKKNTLYVRAVKSL